MKLCHPLISHEPRSQKPGSGFTSASSLAQDVFDRFFHRANLNDSEHQRLSHARLLPLQLQLPLQLRIPRLQALQVLGRLLLLTLRKRSFFQELRTEEHLHLTAEALRQCLTACEARNLRLGAPRTFSVGRSHLPGHPHNLPLAAPQAGREMMRPVSRTVLGSACIALKQVATFACKVTCK